MQQSAFIAHSPYEIGDKVNITFHGDIGIVGEPVTKILHLVEWEAVKNGI